jgi:hypothetical protein
MKQENGSFTALLEEDEPIANPRELKAFQRH